MRDETIAQEDRPLGIVPSAAWRVESAEELADYRIRVRFRDGTEGVVDVKKLIFSEKAGVFAALRDAGAFARLGIEMGAVTWPGELDLAPDAMYDEIKKRGEWIVSPQGPVGAD